MNIKEIRVQLNNIEKLRPALKNLVDSYNKIVILGNGGSSSIASHISQDYTKALGKTSFTFSDSSRLTCYINDYGMEHAYSQFLKEFADKETLVVLISSSGSSDNILNAAKYCEIKNLRYITLSGFNQNNKLNCFNHSDISYWVDSKDYGVIECAHLMFLHSIINY
mgnify:CR=1 FL=1